jgi:hypothetical protein
MYTQNFLKDTITSRKILEENHATTGSKNQKESVSSMDDADTL